MKPCFNTNCNNLTNTKFCSISCSTSYYNKLNPKQKKTSFKPCKWCNKPVHNKVFCTEECKKNYNTENQKYCNKCNCELTTENRAPKQNRCKSCHNEYMVNYLKNRYKIRRSEIIIKLGSKCIDCGNTQDLEIDHNDYTQKEFDISKLWNAPQSKINIELDKCVLRCKTCHIEKTKADFYKMGKKVDHGGGTSGRRNCLCDLCRAKKKEYNSNYYKEKKFNN